MSTIVLRDFPDHLHVLLKQRANDNHRSMTKEAVHLLQAGLEGSTSNRPLPPPVKLRSGRILTIDDIEAAIADGQR